MDPDVNDDGRATTETTRGVAPTPLVSVAALALGAVAMGASPIFVRLADVGPFASAFWRMALAIPFLWFWFGWERRRVVAKDRSQELVKHRGAILVLGFLFAGDLFFWHLAIHNTSVANATLLATMTPIIVTLGAWLVLKETVNARIFAGVALGIAGASLLVGASARFNPENLTGDIYGLVTSFFFGTYVLTMSWARRRLSAAETMFYPSIVTAALLLVAALALDDRLLPTTWQGAAALLALALISHVGGQGLTAYALGMLPAIFSSLVIFVEALAAVILAWLVLSEAVSLWQTVGGLFLLAGIYAARPARSD